MSDKRLGKVGAFLLWTAFSNPGEPHLLQQKSDPRVSVG